MECRGDLLKASVLPFRFESDIMLLRESNDETLTGLILALTGELEFIRIGSALGITKRFGGSSGSDLKLGTHLASFAAQ